MKKLLIITTCLLCFQANIHAQNMKFGKPTDEEMKMTVYEQDPDAAAVVLCQLTNVDYTIDNDNYLVDYVVKTRIKVLKDEGKEYANVTVSYINNIKEELAQESFDSFSATAYNLENGKVKKTKVGKDQLFTERVDEDWMLAKMAVPQVKAGTVVEYEYKLHSNLYYHIHDWVAQTDIPVAFANYRLEVPVTFLFNVEKTGLQPLKSNVTAGAISYKPTYGTNQSMKNLETNVYTCTGRNLKALKKDDFVWNLRDYSTKVTAELQRINAGGGRDVRKTWEQVEKTLFEHPDFGFHLYKHSKYQDELAASGISNISDTKDKVAATYMFLRQRMAWNGEYDLLTKSLNAAVKKGSGSSADLNMMLINMLGDVGVKAYPVILSTRKHGQLPKTYPSLNKLNTFIVAVPDGGSWIYLDASSSDGYLNVLPANLNVERARIIQKGKTGQWVNLQKLNEARTQIAVKATLSPDGTLKGEQSVFYSGNAAVDERRAFREAADSMAFITAKASKDGISITSCKMDGHRDFAPEMKESITFTRQEESAGDHIYLNPFIGVPVTNNPFLDTERLLPIEFPYKQTFSLNVEIKLPEGWKLEEMPKNIKMGTEDKTLSGHVLYEASPEGVITINYLFRLSDVTYTKDQYSTIRELFDLFAARSKDMLIVKKG